MSASPEQKPQSGDATQQTVEFKAAFEALSQGLFSRELARSSFEAILSGSWTPAQVAGLLCALRLRGDSAEVIAGATEAMRAAMVPVAHGGGPLLDTCGTGGDSSGSVNLSTGAAIICASLGVAVAKHGNRAATSKAGSADVLEALGIPTQLQPSAAAKVLADVGITFMIATIHHPAMRFAGPVRKELGIRTLFNCLGPLANPAGVSHQLLGAYSNELRPLLASTLQQLGTQRAWVVCGHDGLDEVSPFGPTSVTALADGQLTELTVSPTDFGLSTSPAEATRGGDAAYNAHVLRAVLAGEAHPSRDAFVLNAAAALVVAEALPLREATARARSAIESGAALRKLEAWKQSANAANAKP
jgi:anthranilate phosphoribosyltransferase